MRVVLGVVMNNGAGYCNTQCNTLQVIATHTAIHTHCNTLQNTLQQVSSLVQAKMMLHIVDLGIYV